MNQFSAEFRFYEESNDFRPSGWRETAVTYRFTGSPGIKDSIEALGVPHTEVELIVVNGHSVGFDYRLQGCDRVAVYPMFESLDVTPLLRLREAPLRNSAFVVDVNLGKLARRLRLLGFDALYRNDNTDSDRCKSTTWKSLGFMPRIVIRTQHVQLAPKLHRSVRLSGSRLYRDAVAEHGAVGHVDDGPAIGLQNRVAEVDADDRATVAANRDLVTETEGLIE